MGGQHALFQVFVFMPFFSSLDLAEGTTVWTGGNDIDVSMETTSVPHSPRGNWNHYCRRIVRHHLESFVAKLI